MNASKKRYDNKWKVTRILLADYLLLKALSQRTGASMAEALHKIITTDLARAEPQGIVWPMPVLALRAKPAMSVNGDKHIATAIKPKGGRIE